MSDADFVYALNHIDPPYTTNLSLAAWTNAINRSLANHQQAIQMLYARGARSFLMPNAVDISKVPYYAYLEPADARFVRERVMDFNTGFAALLNQARASLAGLTIYVPDYFAMLDNLATHPADYGLVHPGVDAVDDPSLTDWSLNGPGTNYLFWDYLDPTAMVQMIIADIAQQLISPVNIGQLTLTANSEWGTANGGRGTANGEGRTGNSNRLALANLPIGRKGFVDAITNFVNWTSVQSIDSSNAFENVFVPAVGPRQFYRLRFPFVWTWP